MYWLWLAYIVDSCAYPALGAAYVGNIQHLNLASFGCVFAKLHTTLFQGVCNLTYEHTTGKTKKLPKRS